MILFVVFMNFKILIIYDIPYILSNNNIPIQDTLNCKFETKHYLKKPLTVILVLASPFYFCVI